MGLCWHHNDANEVPIFAKAVSLNEKEETDVMFESHSQIISAAEELLTKRYGGSQSLTDWDRLVGSGAAVVLRARVASSPFFPNRSVVVKYIPPTGRLIDESTLMREVVSYQFTTSLNADVRPGPVLLAYDVEQHLLVISDSGDGDTFAELLERHENDVRIGILRNLGEAIGKLHVGTAAKEQDFNILLHRMLVKHPEVQPMHGFRERLLRLNIGVGITLVEQAGIAVPDVVKSFAQEAMRRLITGQHRAFTPFDLSPDNIIVADRTEFLDYEWAGFRDAAFDVASVIAGFPQYLFARPISDIEADIFIESWVQQVGDMWPNVRNTPRLHARILTALIGWAFSSVTMMYLGSSSEAYEELFHKVGTEKAAAFDVEEIVKEIAATGDILLGTFISDTSEDADLVALLRQDLYETFEALNRFAQRESDSRFPVVANFAQAVVDLLTDDESAE